MKIEAFIRCLVVTCRNFLVEKNCWAEHVSDAVSIYYSGNYPVPDSMKAEYGAAPHWADSTNDDKSNQFPDSL